MLNDFFSFLARMGDSGPLDWIIAGTFGGIVTGVPVFRLLARWRGWLSDEA